LLILLVSVFDSESVKVEGSDSGGDCRVGDSKKGLTNNFVSVGDSDGASGMVGDRGCDGLSYWIGGWSSIGGWSGICDWCMGGIGHWRNGFSEDRCLGSVGDGGSVGDWGSNGMMSGI